MSPNAVRSCCRPSRAFARDVRGATLIEFALIAPALMALLIAVLMTALTAFAQQCVQTVAEEIARDVLVGAVQTNGTTREQFRLRTCRSLPSFLSCDRTYVDLRKSSDFNNLDISTPDLQFDASGKLLTSLSYDPGNAGDIIVLRVLYRWPIVTAPMGFDLSTDQSGNRLLIGTMVFKSEPFA